MIDEGWVLDLFEIEWEEENDLRSDTVPKPVFAEEGESSRRSRNLKNNDIIHFKDGGPIDHTPRSIGYRDEKLVYLFDMKAFTSKGGKRLFGEDDEQYGGLAGEMKRIGHKYRQGVPNGAEISDPGFDRLEVDSVIPLVDEHGAGIWAAEVVFLITTEAEPIEQAPARYDV